jgi:hypothetical protein
LGDNVILLQHKMEGADVGDLQSDFSAAAGVMVGAVS